MSFISFTFGRIKLVIHLFTLFYISSTCERVANDVSVVNLLIILDFLILQVHGSFRSKTDRWAYCRAIVLLNATRTMKRVFFFSICPLREEEGRAGFDVAR